MLYTQRQYTHTWGLTTNLKYSLYMLHTRLQEPCLKSSFYTVQYLHA